MLFVKKKKKKVKKKKKKKRKIVIVNFLMSDIMIIIYNVSIILWREEQTTDTVGVASGLGEAFIKQK